MGDDRDPRRFAALTREELRDQARAHARLAASARDEAALWHLRRADTLRLAMQRADGRR